MAKLSLRKAVLDVGAGEGLVAAEMATRTGRPVYALDLTPGKPVPEGVPAVMGDAHTIPFKDQSIDALAFQFVLLWVRDPVLVLAEAWRVLRPGGVVMILSEPDLTSRTDEPDTGLGRAICRSVMFSGGHPDAGRRMEGWLKKAGFSPRMQTTTAEWAALTDPAEAQHELAFLQERAGLTAAQIESMAAQEREAALAGVRRVLLPLHYGVGIKPQV